MPLDNQSELFYWVDEHDVVLGSITRQEAHSGSMKRHRSVGVIILNEIHQILLQKRSPQKDMYPNEWQIAVAGHVPYGKTYDQAAEIETEQEIGQRVKTKLLGTMLIDMATQKEMVGVYEARVSSDIELIPDPDEVAELRWIPLDQLHTFLSSESITEWTLQILKHFRYIQ